MKSLRVLLAMLVAGAWITGAWAAIDQGSVDKCKSCHEDVVKNFLAGSHHGKVFQKMEGVKGSCEVCHGNGEKHIGDNKKESIIVFGKKSENSAEEQSKQCLGCHEKNKDLAMWNIGKHKKEEVACSSCHNIHQEGAAKPTPETCFSCHKDIKSQVNKQSHHPILEGKVSCNDCHNPHGMTSHGMLRAENNNQICYKCHADKRGPFIWEHPPVEENCMICHTPHGSQHGKLLSQKQPNLCQDCHLDASHFTQAWTQVNTWGNTYSNGTKTYTSPRLVGGSCASCHPTLHGSVAPSSPAGASMNGKRFYR